MDEDTAGTSRGSNIFTREVENLVKYYLGISVGERRAIILNQIQQGLAGFGSEHILHAGEDKVAQCLSNASPRRMGRGMTKVILEAAQTIKREKQYSTSR